MFIVRYSEIGLKGDKTRRLMEKILIDNIISGSKKYNVNIKYSKTDGRIFLYPDNDYFLYELLPEIFGIKSFSYAYEYKFDDINNIIEIAKEKFYDMVKNKKFAVIAKRKGMHNFTSKDVEIGIGDALYNNSSGVDLENPDVKIYVEIRDNRLYLFTEKIPGPGGLPLKSEGKAISLFSGGIDSPVSTYMIMKRGVACDLLFCSLAHPADTIYMLKVAKNLLNQYSIGYNNKIFLIDGSNLVTEIIKNPDQKFSNLIFKELLYKYAQNLCIKYSYNAIVTGESVGQVSSQTPENIESMSRDIYYPIYRPLIGFDKEETIIYSKSKNLYFNESIGEFCSLFSKNPGIKVSYKDLKNEMDKFDLNKYFKEIIILNKNNIDLYINSIENRYVNEIPDNCNIIDLRDNSDYNKWHVPGAININIKDLNNIIKNGDKNKNYLFYCKKGLNSAYAVSLMLENGYNSFYSTEKNIKKAKA